MKITYVVIIYKNNYVNMYFREIHMLVYKLLLLIWKFFSFLRKCDSFEYVDCSFFKQGDVI